MTDPSPHAAHPPHAARTDGRLLDGRVRPSGAPVHIEFEGKTIPAYEGETIAAAVTAAGVRALRRNRQGEARGVYCGMGVCFECLVNVDGRGGQRACMTPVRAGMRVRVQRHGAGAAGAPAAPLAPAPDGGTPVIEAGLLVLGAGPAGLAAAHAAAGAEADVTVLDERPAPGGQYYKQIAASHTFAPGRPPDRQFAAGLDLIERVRRAGVRLIGEAVVWGAFHDPDAGPEIGVFRAGRVERYRARRLVVATGACERPFPAPGWTLPGVMGSGAAQTLARAYRVAPGRRVLVAGHGPLNFQVACELARGGVEVVGVAEMAARPGLRHAAAVWTMVRSAPDLAADGLRYLAALARRRIPIFYRHALLRAEGAGAVERATLVRIDEAGRPVAGTERGFDVDTLCLGYGFLPSTEVTRLLGCRHRGDDGRPGALVVERDPDGQTSIPGVYVAGDCAGIGGARLALAQGTLAGLAAARGSGEAGGRDDPALPRTTPSASARRAGGRAAAFQQGLWKLFDAPLPADEFMPDDSVVCRCETVRAGVLRGLIREGFDEIGALKRMTRVGMGHCQGRCCGPVVARLCAAAAGRKMDEGELFAPRFPAKPIPAAALAAEKAEWTEEGAGREPPASPYRAAGRGKPGRPAAGTGGAADVAIVGAGILGTCTAYYLVREGVDVALLERGQPNGEASGNNAGSLHVQLLAYDFGGRAQAGGGPAAASLPLQRESAAMWPALAEELGRDLEIEITGGLMVAEDAAHLAGLREKARLERRHGTEVEVLSARELRDLAPYLSDSLAGAAWCPAEGKINPMTAAPAILAQAAARGLRVFRETEVRAIEPKAGGGFELRTNRGRLRAGKVLNAGGGWSGRIAALAGERLPVRAHPIQLVVTEPAPPLTRHLLACAGRHLTMKQFRNGNLVLGGGWPAEADPAAGRPRVLRESLEGNLWVSQRVLPALATLHVIRSWAAVNVAIDGAPLLGESPGVPGLYHAVTVNGMTLGPFVGRVMADAMRTGRLDPALEYFTLSRFG